MIEIITDAADCTEVWAGAGSTSSPGTTQAAHSVAEEVIRRRFAAGVRHFRETYRQRVDYWMLFANNGLAPVLVDEGKNL